MIVNPIATGAVYLALALPPSAWATRHSRRPRAAGVFGAVVGMLLAVLFQRVLPFDFWAHANDFLIEPFLEGKAMRNPRQTLLSLGFHVGVPVLFAIVVARVWPPRDDF